MIDPERAACAHDFLTKILTSRERMLVAAFALGYCQRDVAAACYFCFFQQKAEWVGLMETHPELFEEAKQYEKVNPTTGERYTWSQGESLEELSQPERVSEIKLRRLRVLNSQPPESNRTLLKVFAGDDDEEDERPCLICDL